MGRAPSNAGGLGILGAATMDLDELLGAIKEVKDLTALPFGVNMRADQPDINERAELLASASVQGNVNAPKVVIAEGAQLQGNVAMSTTSGSPAAPVQKAEES